MEIIARYTEQDITPKTPLELLHLIRHFAEPTSNGRSYFDQADLTHKYENIPDTVKTKKNLKEKRGME